MKQIIKDKFGSALIVTGIVAFFFVCFFSMYCGVADIIGYARADHVPIFGIFWGLLQILFSGAFGFLAASAFILPGYYLRRERLRKYPEELGDVGGV